jgi:LysM repeat protein
MKTKWGTGTDMTSCIRCTAVILFVASMALPAWSQQYLLYSPQPVESGQATSSPEGVLVQEIKIQKGDTLYGLSRKFNGKGTYYPQILLFNTIKNPNLIYAGNTLRIPLSQHKQPTLTTETQEPAALEAPVTTPPAELQPAHRIRTSSAIPVPTPAPAPAEDAPISGQKLFNAAMLSYRTGDCRTAIEQFDHYLADYSASPLAADANLYKAECYLKLSAQ